MRIIKINFEKILNVLVFVFSFTLIVSQLMITSKKFNLYYKELAAKGYVYTSAEPFTPKSIELTFKLSGLSDGDNIYILYNGDPVGCFNETTVKIAINNNSVIEIDGRASDKQFIVKITDSNGDKIPDLPDEITVNSNIAMVGRVLVD